MVRWTCTQQLSGPLSPKFRGRTKSPEGPYQAKAIGEWANNATAAATANAVADAIGCQLFELPITAERFYTALHQ
jgi:CO/xanthine dehydrogenase Mo-binding subunit